MHQYIERESGQVRNEVLFGDRLINLIYSNARENAPWLFNTLTSRRVTSLLGFINYNNLVNLGAISGRDTFLRHAASDFSECVEPREYYNTARKIFERQIRYWEVRPMDNDPAAIVSPADARLLIGSLGSDSMLFLKEKFFDFQELFGVDKPQWQAIFKDGEYGIFRLTPEKYHYSHAPVTGVVEDYYLVTGSYHSCNPGAVVELCTPYSKNKRAVTIINTDIPGGSNIGYVAMIEVVALMIGEVRQCYSAHQYDAPADEICGLLIRKGQPKSLFRPGSSTDVLIFQKDRISFADDLQANRLRPDVSSRFSAGFQQTLVETDVKLRSTIAHAK